jgi:glycosyltransferase involved in cell wall biosynthesis
MRILLVSHFFPPRFNAGTENYTLGLARAFQSRGHAVQVLCAEDWDLGSAYWNGVSQDWFDDVSVTRIHLNWLKAANPNRILYDSPPVEAWLDEFLQRSPVDVVHVTSLMSLGIGVLRSVRRAGTPLVLTLMDFWFICPKVQLLRSDGSLCDGNTSAWDCQRCLLAKSGPFRLLEKLPLSAETSARLWSRLAGVSPLARQRGFRGMLLDMDERKDLLPLALSLPDRLLTHSEVVQRLVQQKTRAPIQLLRYGQDLSWVGTRPPRARLEGVRFAYIGQIEPVKGVHVLVQGFQQARLGDRASLDIWGDLKRNPEYAHQLLSLAGDNPCIRFRGRYDRRQLAQVLAEMDALVVPSLWYENAPLVIQEAFAAKIPVIATNLGGMAEAVTDEVNGLLFERGDEGDLAQKLRRFVDEPLLLERLRQGIPPVRTAQAEVDELEAIYQSLVGDKIPERLL